MAINSTEITQAQTSILYKGSWQSIIFSLIVAFIALNIHDHANTRTVLFWYITFPIAYGLRVLLTLAYQKQDDVDHKSEFWLRLFRLSVIPAGLAWGIGSALLYANDQHTDQQLFTILFAAGMSSGAIAVLGSDFPSYRNYSLSILLPLLIYLGLNSSRTSLYVFFVLIVLTAFMFIAAKRLQKSYINTLQLSIDKQALVKELHIEKHRLDNRLSRILQDGSAELYVIDAETLKLIESNTGATDHLGISHDQIQTKSISDIFYNVTAEQFYKLVEPLRDNKIDHVSFDGYHQHADGHHYPVSSRIQYDSDTQSYIITALDMSEFDAANRRAIEYETMTHSVLQSAPVYLWAIDASGEFTFIDGKTSEKNSLFRIPNLGQNIFVEFSNYEQILIPSRKALKGETLTTEIELHDHHFELHYAPLLNNEGKSEGAIGTALDITERKLHEAELIHRANFDELTGLPNRMHMFAKLQQAFDQAHNQHYQVGVIFLDLDNFKTINDALGHKYGDQLLQAVGHRITDTLREHDLAARLSGDEFLIMANFLKRPEDAIRVAEKINEAFRTPYLLDQREVYVGSSIGIAIYPEHGHTPDKVLQCADTAMYEVKQDGRNAYRIFDPVMQEHLHRRQKIENGLRQALDKNEFKIHYQPKVQLKTHRILGAEALLRWQSPNLGEVSPAEFIPIAESAGLINEIGNRVMQLACMEAAEWQNISEHPPSIAVNLSSRQFRGEELTSNVLYALELSQLPAERLELEITEGLLIQDAPETLKSLHTLRQKGITLALDDFGTGYSSLSYLKRFPLQVLKIDKSFIQDIGKDKGDEALIDAIIAMASSLSLTVVAEGVETRNQIDFINARNVDLVQGYIFSKPLSSESFRALLKQQSQSKESLWKHSDLAPTPILIH